MRAKFIGVGGAGGNLADHFVLHSEAPFPVAVVNTDARALGASTAPERLQIGKRTTRGLGSGGDPAIGLAAAREDARAIMALARECDLVLIGCGLGGGTGTGAAPIVAEAARESGAAVIALATLPFPFEGSRREAQARQGLAALQRACDAVWVLPNDRLAGLPEAQSSVFEAFQAGNHLAAQCAIGLFRLLAMRALVRLDLADVASVLHSAGAESPERVCFGAGDAAGPGRFEAALKQIEAGPLWAPPRVLADYGCLLVSVAGGPDLSLAEVNELCVRLKRRLHEDANVFFGASVDESLRGQLSVIAMAAPEAVSVLAAASVDAEDLEEPAEPAEPVERAPREAAPAAGEAEEAAPAPSAEDEPHMDAEDEPLRTGGNGNRLLPGAAGGKAGAQATFDFESPSRGCFEKTAETIYNGENLDIPTYFRKKMRIRQAP